MGEPPVEPGAVNDTVAWVFPATAETAVGAPGTVAGVTAVDGVDAAPGPTAFVAVTVKVYAVPFARPDTVIGDDVPVPVNPPGFDMAV